MWPQVNATALQPPAGRVIGQTANVGMGLGAEGTRLYLTADAGFVQPSSQLDMCRFTLEPTDIQLMNPIPTTIDQTHNHNVLQSKQGAQNWPSADFSGMSGAPSSSAKQESAMKPITNIAQYGFANRGSLQNPVGTGSSYQRPQHDPACRDPNCMAHSPSANAAGRIMQSNNSNAMLSASRWQHPNAEQSMQKPQDIDYDSMRRGPPPGSYGPPGVRKQNEPSMAFGGVSSANSAYSNAAQMHAATSGNANASAFNVPAPNYANTNTNANVGGGSGSMAPPPMGRHPEIEQQRGAIANLERLEMLALFNNVKLEYLVQQEGGEKAGEKAPAERGSRVVKVRLGEEEYVGQGASAQAAQLDAANKALAASRLPTPNAAQVSRIRSEQAASEAGRGDTAQAKCLTKTVEVNNWCSKHRYDAVYSLVERELNWSGDAARNYHHAPFRRNWHHFERNEPTDFIAHLRIERHGFMEWDFFGLARTKKDARQEAARNVFTAVKAVRFVDDTGPEKTEAPGVPPDSTVRQLSQPGTRKWVERRCHELVKSRQLTAQNSDLARVLLIARRFRWKVDVEVIGEKGPPHAKQFTAACVVSENVAKPGEEPAKASDPSNLNTDPDTSIAPNAYSALANGLGDVRPVATAGERWNTKYRVEATDSTKKTAKLRAAKAMLETLRNIGEVERYEAIARETEERERARVCEREARRVAMIEREATNRLRQCIDFYDGLCILFHSNRLTARPRLDIRFLEDENTDASKDVSESPAEPAEEATKPKQDAKADASPSDNTKDEGEEKNDGEKRGEPKRDRFSAELRVGEQVTNARGATKRFVRDAVSKEMLERLGFHEVVETVTQNRAQSERFMFGRPHPPPAGYGGFAPPFAYCGPPPFGPPGPAFGHWPPYHGGPWFPYGNVPPYAPPAGMGVGGPLYTDFGTPPESGDDQQAQAIRETEEDERDSGEDAEASESDDDAEADGPNGTAESEQQSRANVMFVESADGGRYVPIPESLKLLAQQCRGLMQTVRYTLKMSGSDSKAQFECVIVVAEAGQGETEYRGTGGDERSACDEAARAANRELERKLLNELDELKFD